MTWTNPLNDPQPVVTFVDGVAPALSGSNMNGMQTGLLAAVAPALTSLATYTDNSVAAVSAGGSVTKAAVIATGLAPSDIGAAPKNPPVVPVAASRNLALTDVGCVLVVSAGVTLTIPSHASVAWPTDAVILILSQTSGTVTVQQGTGVTLNLNSPVTVPQNQLVGILCPGTADTWYQTGGGGSASIPANTYDAYGTAAFYYGASLRNVGSGTFYPETYGAAPDGTTDNTAAFNACIAAAVTAGGGIIQLAPGNYAFSTAPAVNTTTRTSSAVNLPANVTSSGALTIQGIKGRTQLSPTYTGLSYNGYTGTPSFIGGGTAQLMAGGYGISGFANWDITIRDLLIAIPANPTFGVIDLGCVTRGTVKNVQITAPALPPAVVPTSAWAFGVRTPNILNYGKSRCRDVEVDGTYCAFVISNPHCIMDNTIANYCVWAYGLVGGSDTHLCTFIGAQYQQCVNGLGARLSDEAEGVSTGTVSFGSLPTGGAFYLNGSMDVEITTSGAFAAASDIVDANNLIFGRLSWLKTTAGVGNSSTLTVTGATNLTLTNLGV
jgi:hypothetical protein